MKPARKITMRDRLSARRSKEHQRFQLDLVVLFLLVVLLICGGWTSALRWYALGVLTLFLPSFYVDVCRMLDFDTFLDRLGFEPTKVGRHSGAHPRPGRRQN